MARDDRTGRAASTAAAIERRLRRRLDLLAAGRRVADSAPAILQIVVAVTAAYAIAHYLLGHVTPLLSVTFTLSALGLARDARPRLLVETIVGMLIGIALADLLVVVAGRGLLQLVVVLLVTLVVARAASPSPGFAIAAAIQSALVMLLPDPVGGPFTRTLDALIGAVLAVLVTALVPRDPRGSARRDGRALFSVLTESTGSVTSALADGDPGAAGLALTRLRRTQSMVDAWTTSLDSAVSVARIAPLLRRHLPELRLQQRALRTGDLAARHLRVIARRAEFLSADRQPRPRLAELIGRVGTAIDLVGRGVDDPELTGAARTLLTELAGELGPHAVDDAVSGDGASAAEVTIVMLLRPLVVDLLGATGLPADEARALLPAA
ncbi:aromatic acid exporter family protein [Schumannella sp. 10F1B-5-1]|uniref:FUSC family protein n=1 Tax=Schumannella sp. 10F1B-5-1 TaxID=2590780 RepID=UPI0011302682|nr:FUSC family protein [Schumannella sp. 10F1B-5-1]TPW72839.1 FUSC family protein [Schumannella sp. 10F1B-5-1]